MSRQLPRIFPVLFEILLMNTTLNYRFTRSPLINTLMKNEITMGLGVSPTPMSVNVSFRECIHTIVDYTNYGGRVKRRILRRTFRFTKDLTKRIIPSIKPSPILPHSFLWPPLLDDALTFGPHRLDIRIIVVIIGMMVVIE